MSLFLSPWNDYPGAIILLLLTSRCLLNSPNDFSFLLKPAQMLISVYNSLTRPQSPADFINNIIGGSALTQPRGFLLLLLLLIILFGIHNFFGFFLLR
jgi:hypothetical protein